MEGGYPLHGYNQHSLWQLEVALSAKTELDTILASLPQQDVKLINLVDLGSSEGNNSNILFTKVLSTFRESSNVPVHLHFVDLPSNNWGVVAKLMNSEESVCNIPHTYLSMIPFSFYKVVVPENTAHVVFSSSSFVYLSKVIPVGDRVMPAHSEDKGTRDLATRQSIEDMKLLITCRYQELVPGGFFVFLTNYQHPSSVRGHTDVIQEAHSALYTKGLITEVEYQNFHRSMHYRRYEEWQEILGATSSLFRLVKFEVKEFDSPYYTKYLETNDLEACVHETSEFIRILTELPLKNSLETTSPAVLDQFMEEIKTALRSNPHLEMHYTLVILEKI